MSIKSLPPVPPELKSISPYLQRAEELASQDAVVAYWCACYAAQLGIAAKAKEPASRKFLFDLLDILEKMKAQMSSNDAIEDEAAASAYVENFALKLFTMADNEDRRGEATRKTAKKFLVAANFFEVLRTFDKPGSSSTPTDNSNEDKIRYAKWKAADIAKAFREGRKPTPGPAGSSVNASPSPEPGALQVEQAVSPPPGSTTTSPPPALTDMPPGPGAWSTVATVGTPGVSGGRRNLGARVSGELEGREQEALDMERQTIPREVSPPKEVRFTPSVAGRFSTPGAPPTPSTAATVASSPPALSEEPNPYELATAPTLDQLPPEIVPESMVPLPVSPTVGSAELPPPPPPSQPSFAAPFPPPPVTAPSFAPYSSGAPVAPPPPFIAPRPPVPPPSMISPPQLYYSHPPQAHVSEVTRTEAVELTPVEMARAQKHCKFAISALDYEDVEQARKELRAALRMLGG
ncbi:DUF605-domain-containing protein [Laetiporus sulphureus 93-53]|uniref:DUF605-domain-containing protein n=1 Tax=Laetiporus sulphureus 93-53 TaxID=1314785 RepID=A0A165DXW6_9APHY|nr:DUF605-domain-containing protein [Laetiporus sulphureus 93-53]KZT05846.1 DUF605-domain-containing protein [Laetiporus sulphureus 93-53]